MTLTNADIGAILAKCSGYRPDKTPRQSELVAEAWLEHFAQFPHVTIEDALAGVTVFHRDPHDGMVQPADISKPAREIRRDKSERETWQQLDARENARDMRVLGIDHTKVLPPMPAPEPPKYTRPSQRNDGKPNPLSATTSNAAHSPTATNNSASTPTTPPAPGAPPAAKPTKTPTGTGEPRERH